MCIAFFIRFSRMKEPKQKLKISLLVHHACCEPPVWICISAGRLFFYLHIFGSLLVVLPPAFDNLDKTDIIRYVSVNYEASHRTVQITFSDYFCRHPPKTTVINLQENTKSLSSTYLIMHIAININMNIHIFTPPFLAACTIFNTGALSHSHN